MPWLNSGASRQASIYAATFYPSTIDRLTAVRVSAQADGANPIQLELVRVRGARLAGSVVSRSGGPATGTDVRLFHRFGGFGSESTVAVVSAKGTFEILRVPPGWYRLIVAPRQTASSDRDREFTTRLIEVQDSDIDDLSLVWERARRYLDASSPNLAQASHRRSDCE